jgi:hypothetical protein
VADIETFGISTTVQGAVKMVYSNVFQMKTCDWANNN